MENMITATETGGGAILGKSPERRPKRLMTRKKRRLIFYTLFWVLPVIHFIVFYVILNGSYFTMAFQKYSYATDGSVGYVVEFAKFDNFLKVIPLFSNLRMGIIACY